LIESFEINQDSTRHGTTRKYYSTGELFELSYYVNGILEGVRTLYYRNGVPEIKEKYCAGQICDTLFTFYANGVKRFEGVYSGGEMNGITKGYYESGELKEEVTFKGNQEEGHFVEYYNNGKKKWEGFYLNGANEFGELVQYDSTGIMIKKMMCDSIAICQTIWTPELGDIKINPLFK